jgi:hypothetical protein
VRFQALFFKSHSALEGGKVCCRETSVNTYKHMVCNNPEEPRANIYTYLSLIVSLLVTLVLLHLRNPRTQARKFLGIVFLPLLRSKYSECSHCYKMLRSVCECKRNCSKHLSIQETLELLL